jgi:WhiB family transcriptional regulator, redox-sensing transcriptional regulator
MTVMTGTSKPRIPRPGTAAFSLSDHDENSKEVNNMTLSVIDALVVSDLTEASTLPCRNNDPELFFAESPADVELAKSLCQTCPVRAECLAGALERREPWGVWGGQLLVSGAVVARKRPRGRPRKCDVAA